MSDGWIKLHRKIQDCFLWQDKPFDKARAWIDLLLMAMHHDKKIFIDGEPIVVSRGSFMTSTLKLSDRWGWSRNKVLRFLNVLESEQMLNTKRTQNGTLVTIVKYEVFQCGDTTDETTNETTNGTTDGTTDETQNKNDKNVKNEKNNNMCKKEAQELFEKLWQLYPVKKGKGQVSITAKQRLLKVGYEEMARAIDRYKTELEKDSSWRKPQNGSTFFNSGYVDYLDANYVPGKNESAKKKNSFNNFNQRDYDFAELEKKLISNK